MHPLIPIRLISEIPVKYFETPIGLLLEYHNLGRLHDSYEKAQLLIGMCIDNRKHLHLPDNFSYIIREAGANLRNSEFEVSYAVSVGNIKHIALIGRNQCGMVNLLAHKKEFIQGLVENGGWSKDQAESHFSKNEPLHEIGNEIQFILSETNRLRLVYPKIIFAPMMYLVEDDKLYCIKEN